MCFAGRERGNEFICDTERVVWQDLGARKRSPSRTLIATINGPGRDPFTRSRIPGSDLFVPRLAAASPCCVRIGEKEKVSGATLPLSIVAFTRV